MSANLAPSCAVGVGCQRVTWGWGSSPRQAARGFGLGVMERFWGGAETVAQECECVRNVCYGAMTMARFTSIRRKSGLKGLGLLLRR